MHACTWHGHAHARTGRTGIQAWLSAHTPAHADSYYLLLALPCHHSQPELALAFPPTRSAPSAGWNRAPLTFPPLNPVRSRGQLPAWGPLCAHGLLGVGGGGQELRAAGCGSGAGTQGPTMPSSGAYNPGRGCPPGWIPGGSLEAQQREFRSGCRRRLGGVQKAGWRAGRRRVSPCLQLAASPSGPRAGRNHRPPLWRHDVPSGDKRSLLGKLSGEGGREWVGTLPKPPPTYP